MRIAYVCADPGVPVFGNKGSSVHVQEILRAFVKQGANVELFASRWEGPIPAGLEGLRLHALPTPPKGDPAEREQALLAANHELYLALQSHGPYDLVYERYALWSHAAMAYAREWDIPSALEVNAPLIEEQQQHRQLFDRAQAQWATEQAFGQAQALLPVSQQVAAYLKNFPQTLGRVHVLPNGVNPERFPVGLEPALPHTGFTVGFVGTLKPWHGVEILLEAFAQLHQQHPDSRLLVVGDGPERSNLEAQLAQRGLEHSIHFTGAVEPAQIPGLLASMDVGVAPYPKLEGFYFSPLKVYEYMAAGLAVVASDIGQLSHLLKHPQTGLLCPAGNALELAQALIRLRSDTALRHQLGQAARAEVIAHHTWDQVAQQVLVTVGRRNRQRVYVR